MFAIDFVVGSICVAIMFFIFGCKYADYYWTLAAEETRTLVIKSKKYHIFTSQQMLNPDYFKRVQDQYLSGIKTIQNDQSVKKDNLVIQKTPEFDFVVTGDVNILFEELLSEKISGFWIGNFDIEYKWNPVGVVRKYGISDKCVEIKKIDRYGYEQLIGYGYLKNSYIQKFIQDLIQNAEISVDDSLQKYPFVNKISTLTSFERAAKFKPIPLNKNKK